MVISIDGLILGLPNSRGYSITAAVFSACGVTYCIRSGSYVILVMEDDFMEVVVKDKQDLVDAHTVAKRLGVSYRKVLLMAQSGELPHIRVGDLYRFDPADIEEYIEAQKQKHRKPDT